MNRRALRREIVVLVLGLLSGVAVAAAGLTFSDPQFWAALLGCGWITSKIADLVP